MLETDPPRNTEIRKKVISFFSPAAANELLEVVEQYTSWCIDQFVEKGSCDLVTDLCSPVPAMLTLRLLGLPVTDWPFYSNAVHLGVCTPPEHPDRPKVDALGLEMFGRLWQATEQRRANPVEDLISYFATLEINGEQLSMAEAVGNVFLMLGGGVDTTTALLANTFLHLSENHEARRYLSEDESRLHQAGEEYLRYFAPVPGLSRTVTQPCELGGQQLQPGERVYLSWAGANLDPAEFGDADDIRLDRTANRHTAFGVGAHRCLGSHIARLIWRIVVRETLKRVPDLVVDRVNSAKYTSVATVNGWETMPSTFTPGPAVDAPAPQ